MKDETEIALFLRPALHKEVQRFAQEDNLSIGQMIVRALIDYTDRRTSKGTAAQHGNVQHGTRPQGLLGTGSGDGATD